MSTYHVCVSGFVLLGEIVKNNGCSSEDLGSILRTQLPVTVALDDFTSSLLGNSGICLQSHDLGDRRQAVLSEFKANLVYRVNP